MSGASSDWTRDAAGNYVDWTQPPYREGAILRLVLIGEEAWRLPPAERIKRIQEYYLLVRREMKKKATRR